MMMRKRLNLRGGGDHADDEERERERDKNMKFKD